MSHKYLIHLWLDGGSGRNDSHKLRIFFTIHNLTMTLWNAVSKLIKEAACIEIQLSFFFFFFFKFFALFPHQNVFIK